jgi:competence protein ComEC
MPGFDHIPLFKILMFYVGGIAFAEHFYNLIHLQVSFLLVLLCILSCLVYLSLKFKLYLLFSVLAGMFLFASGIFTHQNSDERNSQSHFMLHYNKQDDFLKVKIINAVKSSNGAKIKCKVIECIKKDTSIDVCGNLLIFSDSIPKSGQYQYGDILIFKSKITAIPDENNPKAFDPSDYYHYYNIHYQCFINKGKFIHQRSDKDFLTKRWFEQLNRDIKKSLLSIIPDKTNANLAISIILGDKQDLDRDIMTSFSNTGIRHILTVSGMHVGIVALILNFVFSFIRSNSLKLRILKIVLTLTGIWFYSFLTGNEPAILRASFMISLIMISITLKKNSNSLNILFGSALLLLIYYPLQMYQLSFILSYMAMLSILIFYTPVYKLINAGKYKIIHYLWQLASLSIAAQILMYPLSIFYFHNGPTLFILTSVIATPMAFAALAIGFTGVIFNLFFHQLALLIGKLISLLFDWSLAFINYIDSISANTGEFFYIGHLDLLIIYLLVLFISIYIINKKRLSLIMIFALSISLLISQFIRIKDAKSNDEMVVFHAKKNVVADFYINGECYNFSKNRLSEIEYGFTNRNYRLYKGVDKTEQLDEKTSSDFFIWKFDIFKTRDKTIVFLNDENDLIPSGIDKIDVLVLSEKISYSIRPVLDNFDIAQIVLSTDMDYKVRNYLKSLLSISEIPVWDINEKGAFIYKIN